MYIAQWAFNPHKVSFIIIQIYFQVFHALFLYKIGLFIAFFHPKCIETFLSYSKYIGILDLVRVGQY